MNKKAQFLTLRNVVIAAIVFVVLAFFIGVLVGALPTPKEIVKSLLNLFF